MGIGAEDADDALGRLLLDIVLPGVELQGLDLLKAPASCVTGPVEDVVLWSVIDMGADVVLVLSDSVSVLPHVPHGDYELHTISRETCLSELKGWLVDQRGTAESHAGEAAQALRRASRRHQAPLEVSDRHPRVSVIVPTYNHAAYIDAAMGSVLAQTFQDFEVVVVDDGSTDGTLEALSKYESDPRVTVLTHRNIGHTGRIDLPLNRAINSARGDVLAWFGGDDVSYPCRIERQLEAFEEDPTLDICHSAADMIDAAGDVRGLAFALPVAYDELSILREMSVNNFVGAPSIMTRKSVFQQMGLFEEGVTCDYHFWLKSAGRARFRYVAQRLVQYRRHDLSLTGSSESFTLCHNEGRRVRADVVLRRTLADFYPELSEMTDAHVWYEAGIALGNQLLREDARLALYAYDLAGEHFVGADLQHNRAIAHAAVGDSAAALKCAQAAGSQDVASDDFARRLLAGGSVQTSLRTPDLAMAAAIAESRQRLGHLATRWDGTKIAVQRAYVEFDSKIASLDASILREWCATTNPDMPIRWVYPTRGAGVDHILWRLASAVGADDLSTSADIVIETIDDFALLPPEEGRPTGTLRTAQDITSFRSWLTGQRRPLAA